MSMQMWSSFAYRHALFIAGISDPCYRRLLCLHDSIYDNQVVLTVAGRPAARQSHLPPSPSSRRPSPPPPPPPPPPPLKRIYQRPVFGGGQRQRHLPPPPSSEKERRWGRREREREKVKERKKEKENERKGEAETEGEAAIPGMAHKAPNGLFITPTTSTTGVRDR